MNKPAVTVVGIGNSYRSDDAVGLYVARRIRERGLQGVAVTEGISDGYALIDAWADADIAFVVDCAWSGSPPGTTHRFEVLTETIPSEVFSGLSTHSVAINDAIELAKVMNRLPNGLVVYGIEGDRVIPGNEISTAVREGAEEVIEAIVKEIRIMMKS